MMNALIKTGERLAEALHAENEALASLDFGKAAGLSSAKVQASDAFAAAFAAASRTNARALLAERQNAAAMAQRLQNLGQENRRLLERAIMIQSKVIETIAGAALPKTAGRGYGAVLRRPGPAPLRATPAMALAVRA